MNPVRTEYHKKVNNNKTKQVEYKLKRINGTRSLFTEKVAFPKWRFYLGIYIYMTLLTEASVVNSLWPIDVTWCYRTWSRLAQVMLTYHQSGLVAFPWGQHRKGSKYLSLKSVWNLLVEDYSRASGWWFLSHLMRNGWTPFHFITPGRLMRANMADAHRFGTESPPLTGKYGVYVNDIWRACCSTHRTLRVGSIELNVVSTTRKESLRYDPDEEHWFRDEELSGIEWSSSGPYFDCSFLVMDITFRSVIFTCIVQRVERDASQISFTYTPYLSVNGGDSVPKRCASAKLDEGHCSAFRGLLIVFMYELSCSTTYDWCKINLPEAPST